MRRLIRLTGVLSLSVLGFSGCGGSEGSSATSLEASTTSPSTSVATTAPTTVATTPAPTTTIAAPASTEATEVTEPTTTTAAPPLIPNDAEPGLTFDVGAIAAIDVVEGVTVIAFDRYQAYDETGELRSGLDFTSEYTIGAFTDWPFVNENPALRSYPLAPSVAVWIIDPAWLAGQDEFCGGDGTQVDKFIAWVPEALETGLNGMVASLAFDTNGWVTSVRFMQGC